MTATTPEWRVAHTSAVPFGDDPVVLIQVAITNANANEKNSSTSAAVQWAEVFSSLMVQMDRSDFRLPGVDRRAFSVAHYASSFSALPGGISHARRWLGLTAAEQEHLGAAINYTLPPGASAFDERPPTSFAAVLHPPAGPVDVGNDGAAFFGSGGPAQPAGRVVAFLGDDDSSGVPEGDASLVLRTALPPLRPGETTSLYMLWGYTPQDAAGAAQRDALLSKYSALLPQGTDLASLVAAEWRAHLSSFSAASLPWLGAETLWNGYYTQAGLSYDSFFGEHILNQGMTYQYSDGEQAAARDPVQHALPLVETRPAMAASVLRYTLKGMMPTWHTIDPDKIVNLPYGLAGSGVYSSAGNLKPDDMELYVLLLASEYLLATRDLALLEERVSYYGSDGAATNHTVLAALQRCLYFVVDGVGCGPHGIMRQLTSDWDDFFHPPAAAYNLSESVLTAALATFALDRAADAFELAGDSASSAKASAFAAANRAGIYEHAWNGQWLRRAWWGPDVGWVGDINVTGTTDPYPGLFSAQQGWALAGGVFSGHAGAAANLTGSLAQHCRDHGWNYGFPYYCDVPRSGRPLPPGVPTAVAAAAAAGDPGTAHVGDWDSDAGSMWFAVNHPTVLGLVRANASAQAWEEFERNSLNWQARVTPHLWAGIWTSADQHHNDGDPGWNAAFPALCMHRHAWPLVTLRHLVGLQYGVDGLLVRPALPTAVGAYAWSSALSSLAWDGNHTWSGAYRPATRTRVGLAVDMNLVVEPGTRITLHVVAGEGTRDIVASAAGVAGPDEAAVQLTALDLDRAGPVLPALHFVIHAHAGG